MEKKFENQIEWQKSSDLAVSIHKLLAHMPSEEYENEFSLSNEIKRNAISIPSKKPQDMTWVESI